jgi:hypothetical protein
VFVIGSSDVRFIKFLGQQITSPFDSSPTPKAEAPTQMLALLSNRSQTISISIDSETLHIVAESLSLKMKLI